MIKCDKLDSNWSALITEASKNHGISDLAYTVMILSFRTVMPRQTVQSQIRLLLHCLLFRLHRLDSLLYGEAT